VIGDPPKRAALLRAQFAKELESLESAARVLRDGVQRAPSEALELMLNVCHNCLQRAVDLHAHIEKAES
jgi:hypothetical protein